MDGGDDGEGDEYEQDVAEGVGVNSYEKAVDGVKGAEFEFLVKEEEGEEDDEGDGSGEQEVAGGDSQDAAEEDATEVAEGVNKAHHQDTEGEHEREDDPDSTVLADVFVGGDEADAEGG